MLGKWGCLSKIVGVFGFALSAKKIGVLFLDSLLIAMIFIKS